MHRSITPGAIIEVSSTGETLGHGGLSAKDRSLNTPIQRTATSSASSNVPTNSPAALLTQVEVLGQSSTNNFNSLAGAISRTDIANEIYRLTNLLSLEVSKPQLLAKASDPPIATPSLATLPTERLSQIFTTLLINPLLAKPLSLEYPDCSWGGASQIQSFTCYSSNFTADESHRRDSSL